MDRETGVVLVGAGEGRRFGGPKAFVELEGRTLLERAAAPFAAFPFRVVVLRPADLARAPAGWTAVAGGARRRDSVAAGLAALPAGAGIVLVHDVARPLATPGLVQRVVEAARRHGAVVPALPLSDTIKEVAGDRVVRTLPRSALAAVQTPQGFRADLLRRALAATEDDATDEAALVEALGEEVRTVPGEPGNIKITGPGDLERAAALLRGR